MKNTITNIIDFTYRHIPIVRRLVPLQTFRYAAVGGANMLYGIVQYWFIYNYILLQQDVCVLSITISGPICAFLLNFIITFFTGFLLVKHIAFDKSQIHSSTQIIRYGMVVALNILINYLGIKLLVEVCNFYPSVSNALIQIITVNISFLINKYFTFKA